MTQENIFQITVYGERAYKAGGVEVVEVTVVGHDTAFEIGRIWTGAEHFGVVVGFDHNYPRETHIVIHPVGDMAEVGSYGKSVSAALDIKSHVVGAVVAHIKGRYRHSGQLERKFLVDRRMIVFYAAGNVVAAQQAVECLGGAVNGYVLRSLTIL